MPPAFQSGSSQLRTYRHNATALITTCCANREPLLVNEDCAGIVLESLHWFEAQRRIRLFAAIVMPDHIHFVADPLDSTWSSLMKSLKGFTARSINQRLARSGPVWQEQYHDRRIDADEHLVSAVHYCLEHPVRAGLVANAGEWKFAWSRKRVFGG